MKRIISVILIFTILCSSIASYAQSNVIYTHADTVSINTEKYQYSHSIWNTTGCIVGNSLAGGGIGLIFGIAGTATGHKSGEAGIGVAIALAVTFGAGIALGFLTGVGKATHRYYKFKDMKHNVKGLIEFYNYTSTYREHLLLSSELASTGDLGAYLFLVNEYRKDPYSKLNKKDKLKRDLFEREQAKIIAYAAAMNYFYLDPLLESKTSVQKKYEVLVKIPHCINVTSLKNALDFLRVEAEIARQEECKSYYYLSDVFYEMTAAYLLTRRNDADYNQLIRLYDNESNPVVKFWFAFALAEYKYDDAIPCLIEWYNNSTNGNYRHAAIKALKNFDTPQVVDTMKKALNDEYIPPNLRKSKMEERYIIKNLAQSYFKYDSHDKKNE